MGKAPRRKMLWCCQAWQRLKPPVTTRWGALACKHDALAACKEKACAWSLISYVEKVVQFCNGCLFL